MAREWGAGRIARRFGGLCGCPWRVQPSIRANYRPWALPPTAPSFLHLTRFHGLPFTPPVHTSRSHQVYFRTLNVIRRAGLRPHYHPLSLASHGASLLPALFVHLPAAELSTDEQSAEFIWQVIEKIA